jgi:hypothetical protein
MSSDSASPAQKNETAVKSALKAAFAGVTQGMPDNWSMDAPLDSWECVSLNEEGVLTGVYLARRHLKGNVDLTRLPDTLVLLMLSDNDLEGPVALSALPRTLTTLWLHGNPGLTGEWTGPKPDAFDFRRTGIVVRA